MADVLEGARTPEQPVKFKDREDGSWAELLEVRNPDPTEPVFVCSVTPVQTAFAYDSAGNLSGWTEGPYRYTVARNVDGSIASITRV